MATRSYSVSELRKIVKESANEFKPVYGKNVESDNKKINDKAYKDMEKETNAYDGGARSEKKSINYPFSDNRGMEDLQYNNMNDDFKNKVKSQLKGYTSSDAEKKHKNDPYGNAEFNDIKGIEDKTKELQKGKDVAKQIGLTSREINKKDFEDLQKSVFENKMFTIKFKNTLFVTENHMLSRVPDNFKVEGKKFIMKDKMNNEFLVEWHEEPIVTNKTKINEQKNRIQELFNYKRGESNTTNESRLTEDKKFSDILGKARKLMK